MMRVFHHITKDTTYIPISLFCSVWIYLYVQLHRNIASSSFLHVLPQQNSSDFVQIISSTLALCCCARIVHCNHKGLWKHRVKEQVLVKSILKVAQIQENHIKVHLSLVQMYEFPLAINWKLLIQTKNGGWRNVEASLEQAASRS